ncbi:MAG: hypothetical protein ACW98Y_13905 [Candidatus Thorarchaeota archaeon]|jgi:hypothetical protein
MHANQESNVDSWSSVLFYGVSASSVRSDIDTVTGKQSGKFGVKTEETGTVFAQSEVTGGSGSGYCDCSCSGGGGDGEAYLLIVIAVLMILFAIVWAIVMLAFAIMTLGGFVKRRYRTRLVIEKENKELIGKLAVLTFRKGGVAKYQLGSVQYDDWADDTFTLFVRKKYIRQISFFIGYIWGAIEIITKLNQILIDPADYNLWPVRIVMIAIMLPLLLYSPFLEFSIRGAFETGGEAVDRLIMEHPIYSPESQMKYSSEPIVDDSTPSSVIDEEDSNGYGNQY